MIPLLCAVIVKPSIKTVNGIKKSVEYTALFGVKLLTTIRLKFNLGVIMQITGRCHCGEVTYHAEVDETKVLNCHCTDCQVISSGPFRTVVLSKANAITFTASQPKEYIKVADSGNKRAQGFCGNCGTSLYATSVGEGDKIYGLRIGAIEQREQLIPKTQIWCRSSPAWLKELNTITGFDTVPNG